MTRFGNVYTWREPPGTNCITICILSSSSRASNREWVCVHTLCAHTHAHSILWGRFSGEENLKVRVAPTVVNHLHNPHYIRVTQPKHDVRLTQDLLQNPAPGSRLQPEWGFSCPRVRYGWASATGLAPHCAWSRALEPQHEHRIKHREQAQGADRGAGGARGRVAWRSQTF